MFTGTPSPKCVVWNGGDHRPSEYTISMRFLHAGQYCASLPFFCAAIAPHSQSQSLFKFLEILRLIEQFLCLLIGWRVTDLLSFAATLMKTSKCQTVCWL
jgi:hypothetical protein